MDNLIIFATIMYLFSHHGNEEVWLNYSRGFAAGLPALASDIDGPKEPMPFLVAFIFKT
jgi:hypothetical protein